MGTHQRTETRALLAAFISLVIAYVAMDVYLHNASAIWLISGRRNLVSSAIVAFISFVVFLVGYARTPLTPVNPALTPRHKAITVIRRIIEAVALSIVFASTTFFTAFALFSMGAQMLGEIFDSFTLIIVAAATAVAAYLGYLQASSLSAKVVATMLPLFMLSGVTVAALTSDDPWWWHNNFSQLGDRTTFAAGMFNSTLILGGVCILIVTYFTVIELFSAQLTLVGVPKRDAKGHLVTRTPHFMARLVILTILMCMAAICLIGIGSFRYTPHPTIHNFFARGICVPAALLLVGLPWLVPGLSAIVYVVSDAAIAAVGVIGIIWMRGGTTLTNVEALACMVLLGWIVIFARQIAAIQSDRIRTQFIALARASTDTETLAQAPAD